MTSTKSLKEICKIQLSTGLRNKLQGWFLLNHHQSEAGLCLAWHERFIPNFCCFQLSCSTLSPSWNLDHSLLWTSQLPLKQLNKWTKQRIKKRGRKKPSHLWEKTWQEISKADTYLMKTGQIHRTEMHRVLLIIQKPLLAQQMSPLENSWRLEEYERRISHVLVLFLLFLWDLLAAAVEDGTEWAFDLIKNSHSYSK